MRKLLNNKLCCRYILIIYILLVLVFVTMKLYDGGMTLVSGRSHIITNRSDGYWNINLTPFKTLKYHLKDGLNTLNIYGNTIPFMILGFLISISEDIFKVLKSFAFCFLSILFFEVFQFITCIGFFDVDDILLNALSGFVGIIIYYFVKKLFVKY